MERETDPKELVLLEKQINFSSPEKELKYLSDVEIKRAT